MANPTLDRLEAVTAQLERLAVKLTKGGGGSGGGGEEAKLAPSAEAWNEYYSDFVQPFIDASKKLNLADTVRLTEQGWKNVGQLMRVAPGAKKPSQGDVGKFVKPAADAISEAGSLKDKRRKETIYHDSAYAELVISLGWVMQPKPMPWIQGQLEAADFYLTKVLTTNKDATNKEDHRAWVRLAKEMMSEMKAFVKQFHRAGVEYKGQGSIFDAPKAGGAGAPVPPRAGVPPPAVPPPAAAASAAPKSSTGGSGGGFGAVLASINKGSNITSGLKKVTSDMKTKNRKERPGLVKVAPKKSAAGPSKWAQKSQVDRPAATRMERGNHVVEYYKSGEVVVPVAEPKPVSGNKREAYKGVFIYKCGEALVTVPHKVKNIVIDGCRKTRIVIGQVVSTIEVVNCQSITVIFTNEVKSIAVDKTNGCQIWCDEKSRECLELMSSMVSEVNIQVPGATAEDDPIEMAVPEQFKTIIKYPLNAEGKADYSKQPTLITEHVKHG